MDLSFPISWASTRTPLWGLTKCLIHCYWISCNSVSDQGLTLQQRCGSGSMTIDLSHTMSPRSCHAEGVLEQPAKGTVWGPAQRAILRERLCWDSPLGLAVNTTLCLWCRRVWQIIWSDGRAASTTWVSCKTFFCYGPHLRLAAF